MRRINGLAKRVNNIAFDLGETQPFEFYKSKDSEEIAFETNLAALDRLIARFEDIAHQVDRRPTTVGIGQLKMF